MVQSGELKLIDVVTEISLAIAEVTSSEGKLISPRSAFSMQSNNTPEWLSSLLLGKKIGESLVTPSQETVTVIEVYVPTDEKLKIEGV
jgi:hypothetical protein